MTMLLQKISGKGGAYKYPQRPAYLELGDEEDPASPSTPEQRAQYERIRANVTVAEDELKKFEAAGVKIPVAVAAQRQSGGSVIPIVRTRGTGAGQPAETYQPDAGVACVEQGLDEIVRAGGVVVQQPQQQQEVIPESTLNRLIVPALTREQIGAAEKRGTIEAYLQRSIDQAADVYETCGLNAWAQEARRLQANMSQYTPEQLSWMDRRRMAGDIIFPMPGSGVLMETYRAALEQLRPQFTNTNGRRQMQTQLPSLCDHYTNLIAARDASLTSGIETNPYFAVFTPSDRTPEDSRSKTLDQQIQWLTDHQSENTDGRPDTVLIDAIGPAEYGAAQALWTKKGGGPFDGLDWTRFIEITKSSDGDVPRGDWNLGEGRLRFDGGGAGASSHVGVRLLGRVKY